MLSEIDISRIIDAGISKKADYVEVYIEQRNTRSVSMLNSKVTRAGSAFDSGVGIRLMSGVNTVYVYSNDFDVDGLIKLASDAADALNTGVASQKQLLSKLVKSEPYLVNKDPMLVSKSSQVDYLRQASSYALSYDPLITQTAGSLVAENRHTIVANSKGHNKEEEQKRIRLSFSAVATSGNEKQTGRVSPGWQKGYEAVEAYPIIEETKKCCDSAIRMVGAGYAPSGMMPVVICNGFGGVIFHEACGHALEATSVGIKSSCFTDKLGKQIASTCVSARDNARIKGEWGSYFSDDEGNESSDLLLIENGICKNYLVDELGSRRMRMPVTGCSRRQDYSYAPTSRMSNTYICPGTDKKEDIIANTENGLYCANMGGGSVDTSTGEFNFAVNEAYMIRNGKIEEPVRGATLIGKGQEVLMNIDKVSDDLELSAGICGSLSGGVPVTVGQPTIRVSQILVGGRD